MNYLTLSTAHNGNIFRYIFDKYRIPLELRIIIFYNLTRYDLFHFFKNVNLCLEIDCVFNAETVNKVKQLQDELGYEQEMVKTQIQSICPSNCKDKESQDLLLTLIQKYNEYEIMDSSYKTFFDTRVKFYTQLAHNSYISKYYECVDGFNKSDLVRNRKFKRIDRKLRTKEQILISSSGYFKKDLIKILETNNVPYYNSWNKKRMVNAYYQNV